MDLQRVDLAGWQGMGSRGGWDGVARAREEQAAGLLLTTREIPMSGCRLCMKEQPKSHLNMDFKHKEM